MSYEALLTRLAAARGRDIPTVTCDEIQSLFVEMGPKNAEYIVNQITEYENLPSNLSGLVKKMWREIKSRTEHDILLRETWKANKEDCSTSEEWKYLFEILSEVQLWHQLKLVKGNPDGVRTTYDVLEWEKQGCPKTWSPIIDHFLKGFLKAHVLPGGACESFLKSYLKQLQDSRKNKTEQSLQNNLTIA